MRVRSVVVALAVLAMPLAAQTRPASATDRGSKLVGGSASVTHTSSEGFSGTQIQVSPDVLFFVQPRLALGGQVSLAYASSDGGDSNSWALGPAARFYFATQSTKSLPFVGAALQYRHTSFDAQSAGSVTFSGLSAEINAGISYMLATHVALDAIAFFEHAESQTNSGGVSQDQPNQNTMGLRFGIAAFVF